MAATERTYLTRPNDPPHYVEFAGILRNRRNRIRQFQCCLCAFLLALFVMSIVVTISYSISHTTTNNLTATENSTRNLLKSAGPNFNPDPLDPNSSSLTEGETIEGIKAGNEAIQQRRISDTYTKPLPSPSPNFRHQFAVSTSLEAGVLALAGVGEIAATKRIEDSRSLLGKPSSIGSYFNGGWTPHGSCKEFTKITCNRSKYRSYDGTCNHPKQWGAAMTPYRRILPPAYADKINSPRRTISGKALPSAREVSLKVHQPSPSSNPAFTVMLAVFGQFLDHDITATAISQGINGSSLSCCSSSVNHPECFPVQVGHGDPVYDIGKSSCMEFVRSAPASQCKIGPRQQLNQVTSFIDGSTIYGSDTVTINELREFQGGRLRMQLTSDNRTLLPKSTNFNDGCNRKLEWNRGRYCFAAGDKRANENLHLTTMHLLWARQHDRLADQLSELNPSWDDETLFQEARRIVGAQMQHITYNELIPIVLGESITNSKNLKPLKSGFRQVNITVNPALANNFASSAFRFAHTLLPGLMRVTDAEKGTTSYIELHRMLFNPYSLYSEEGITKSVTMATSNVIQKTSTHVTSQLTSHLFEDPASNKTLPCGLDLVSLNIQRGRDHGLPGYTKWREYCGLKKPAKFSDLKDDLDPEALDAISKLYSSVDDVDLYTGALAEIPRSDGIVGSTFTCLIGEQFERSQQGDSFWYENSDQPGSFSEEQLRELRKTSLAKVLCDCSDGITEIQAEVMKSEEGNNPIISCEDIPEPSLEAWKEAPNLAAGEPAEDTNWLAFKNDINKTVQGITDLMKGNEPSISDDDYLTFQKEIDESFEDLRNELQGLRPQSLDPDFFNSTSLDDPLMNPASLNDPSLITNLMIFMNNSLEDAANQVSLVGKKSSVLRDWETFKANLNKVLNSSVDQLKEGSSSRQDWLAFKDKIKVEVRKIKEDVADMKNHIAIMKKNPKLQEVIDEDTDSKNLKTNVVESINEIVDVIEDNLPPPDDPNRKIYVQHVKNQFSHFRNGVMTKKPTDEQFSSESNSSIADFSQWENTKKSFVKSINEAILNINTNKPDWSDYRDEIKNKFSEKSAKSSVDESSEWVKFKLDLNEILEKIIENIKDNAPPPGNPLWPEYRMKIIDMLSKFRNYIPMKPKVLLKISEGTVFDYTTFRSDLNKSLCELIEDKKSGKLVPGDPRWGQFRKKFHKSMNDSRYRMSVLKLSFEESSKSDWMSFREDLKESIKNVVQFIKENAPPHGSPDWIEFRKEIRKKFAVLRKEFDLRKDEILGEMYGKKNNNHSGGDDDKKSNSKIDDTEIDDSAISDWNSLKTDLNKTVITLLRKTESRKCWVCDSKWMKFINYVNKSISDFKCNVSNLSLKPHKKHLLLLTNDWSNFSDQMNESLADALKNVENEKVSKNLDWMNLRESIKDNVAKVNEEIARIKEEWLLKIQEDNKIVNVSDLKNLEETTNRSFSDLKNQVKNLEIEPIRFNITDDDWRAFKDSINKTVINYIKSINQNDSYEWTKFKDFVNKSMNDIKNQIASLRNNIDDAVHKIKEEKNSMTNSNNETLITTQNNQEINEVLDSLNNSSMTNSNLNKIREALVRTRDQILGLSYHQLQADSESTQDIPNWTKFEDSIQDNFNELDNAIKDKNTDLENNMKSSASDLTTTILNNWINYSILIVTLIKY